MIKFTKNNFEKCKLITWDDVIEKLSFEFEASKPKFIFKDKFTPPSFVMHTKIFPNTLRIAFNEIKSRENILDMHVYMSLGKNSSTFGRHKDSDHVLIVQAIGNAEYSFDDGKKIYLEPGDSLAIKEGVYHTPMVFGPRVTLSACLPKW